MTPTELGRIMKAVGLTTPQLGPFFGYTRVSGYRWVAVGPPPVVAKFLRYMRAANLTAEAVNKTIGAEHG